MSPFTSLELSDNEPPRHWPWGDLIVLGLLVLGAIVSQIVSCAKAAPVPTHLLPPPKPPAEPFPVGTTYRWRGYAGASWIKCWVAGISETAAGRRYVVHGSGANGEWFCWTETAELLGSEVSAWREYQKSAPLDLPDPWGPGSLWRVERP